VSLHPRDTRGRERPGARGLLSSLAKTNVVRHSLIYTLGSVANKSLGFLLIPVYTRYFSVHEYGVIAILNVISQLASFVFLLGISSAAMRFYFDKGADEAYRRGVYGNAVLLLLVVPSTLFFLLSPTVAAIMRAFFPEIPFFPLGLTVLATNVFSPMTLLILGYYRVREMAKPYVLYSFSFFLLQAVSCIIAVILLRGGIEGQFYAQFLVTMLFWGIALWVLIANSDLKPSVSTVRSLMLYGLPLMPMFLAIWLETASVRIFLERTGSFREVGLFSVASQFAGVLVVVGAALDSAIIPFYFQKAQQADGPRVLGRFFVVYSVFCGLLAILVAIAAEPMVRIMADASFHSAALIVPLLVFAAFLDLMFRLFNWSLLYRKKTLALAVINISTTLLLIVLLALFLAKWHLGTQGAACAMIVAGATRIGIGYTWADYHYHMDIDFRDLFVPLSLLMAAFVAVTCIHLGESVALRCAFRGAVFGCVVLALLRGTALTKSLKALL
jgi:O-antigen/teichoic acid export membrane protein